MVVVWSRFTAGAPAAEDTRIVRLGEFAGIGVGHAPKSPHRAGCRSRRRRGAPLDLDGLHLGAAPSTDVDEVAGSVRRIAEDPMQRLVVAVTGGDPVGVAHLRRAPVSPIHSEDAVHVGYLHVMSKFRRRGLGKQLIETAADWAEELGSPHIVASVAANARESNRFLARLGMSQVAVVRATTVSALKGKLRTPVGPAVIPNVVTARRLMRV